VPPGDLEERFIRGAGPGGQKINKTATTVCVRHVPTGLEVRCQRERTQAANRRLAWESLCNRLAERVRAEKERRRQAREAERRRNRPKSPAQKAVMRADKRHRARRKATRGRVEDE